MASCKELLSQTETDTTMGSPYEVLVVCDTDTWKGELGNALREVLQEPVEMLNQYEPKFNTLHVIPEGFSSVFMKHRNILKVVCSSDATNASITAEYNVSSSPQIVLTLKGPSTTAMAEYLKENGKMLLQTLESAERNRTVSSARESGSEELTNAIRTQFDIDMPVSSSYATRNIGTNFVWASNEFPRASQGFFVYTHPYNSENDLSTKSLVKARSEAAKRIPGPADGSYMTTVTKIPDSESKGYIDFLPERKVVNIDGREWIELRGFWEVEGDFMGGPFVSYTTLDKRTNKLLTIDGYIYSPKDNKRNMLRKLEHLVYGVSFPAK